MKLEKNMTVSVLIKLKVKGIMNLEILHLNHYVRYKMSNSKLLEELENCSKDDLELIESTQQDLYTPEEMAIIHKLIRKKEIEENQARVEYIKQHLPKTITCPKCSQESPFSNDRCAFCDYPFDKKKYFDIEYYENEEYAEEPDDEERGQSYLFQYIISFLIPLVGFILGAILLSKDDEEEKSVGKTCIILGIVSVVIGVIVYLLLF